MRIINCITILLFCNFFVNAQVYDRFEGTKEYEFQVYMPDVIPPAIGVPVVKGTFWFSIKEYWQEYDEKNLECMESLYTYYPVKMGVGWDKEQEEKMQREEASRTDFLKLFRDKYILPNRNWIESQDKEWYRDYYGSLETEKLFNYFGNPRNFDNIDGEYFEPEEDDDDIDFFGSKSLPENKHWKGWPKIWLGMVGTVDQMLENNLKDNVDLTPSQRQDFMRKKLFWFPKKFTEKKRIRFDGLGSFKAKIKFFRLVREYKIKHFYEGGEWTVYNFTQYSYLQAKRSFGYGRYSRLLENSFRLQPKQWPIILYEVEYEFDESCCPEVKPKMAPAPEGVEKQKKLKLLFPPRFRIPDEWSKNKGLQFYVIPMPFPQMPDAQKGQEHKMEEEQSALDDMPGENSTEPVVYLKDIDITHIGDTEGENKGMIDLSLYAPNASLLPQQLILSYPVASTVSTNSGLQAPQKNPGCFTVPLNNVVEDYPSGVFIDVSLPYDAVYSAPLVPTIEVNIHDEELKIGDKTTVTFTVENALPGDTLITTGIRTEGKIRFEGETFIIEEEGLNTFTQEITAVGPGRYVIEGEVMPDRMRRPRPGWEIEEELTGDQEGNGGPGPRVTDCKCHVDGFFKSNKSTPFKNDHGQDCFLVGEEFLYIGNIKRDKKSNEEDIYQPLCLLEKSNNIDFDIKNERDFNCRSGKVENQYEYEFTESGTYKLTFTTHPKCPTINDKKDEIVRILKVYDIKVNGPITLYWDEEKNELIKRQEKWTLTSDLFNDKINVERVWLWNFKHGSRTSTVEEDRSKTIEIGEIEESINGPETYKLTCRFYLRDVGRINPRRGYERSLEIRVVPGSPQNLPPVIVVGENADDDATTETGEERRGVKIHGIKYLEKDNNRSDEGYGGYNRDRDSPIEYFPIFLEKVEPDEQVTPIGNVLTNRNGEYEFRVSESGTYIVKEEIPDGWVNTEPDEHSYTININLEESTIPSLPPYNFGNFRTGEEDRETGRSYIYRGSFLPENGLYNEELFVNDEHKRRQQVVDEVFKEITDTIDCYLKCGFGMDYPISQFVRRVRMYQFLHKKVYYDPTSNDCTTGVKSIIAGKLNPNHPIPNDTYKPEMSQGAGHNTGPNPYAPRNGDVIIIGRRAFVGGSPIYEGTLKVKVKAQRGLDDVESDRALEKLSVKVAILHELVHISGMGSHNVKFGEEWDKFYKALTALENCDCPPICTGTDRDNYLRCLNEEWNTLNDEAAYNALFRNENWIRGN